MHYTERFPGYTVGEDAYAAIADICASYGKTAAVIGGNNALSAAMDGIREGCGDTITIADVIWYGGEASRENIDMLMANEVVRTADMIFGVGGGKAMDAVKVVAQTLKKPFFTFPTIASTCAACTSLGIIYYPSGELREYSFSKVPANHVFISTQVIAKAPSKYIWAGIGDTLAKYYECTVSARGMELAHSDAMGRALCVLSAEPLVKYGHQAIADCEAGTASFAVQQTALGIIISTGFVSNLVDIGFNTGLAHAVYNGLTVLPETEHHLHGEVVAYGVMVLLTCDEQFAERDRIFDFNTGMKLPVCLADIGLTVGEIMPAVKKAGGCMDIKQWPYEITEQRIYDSICALEEYVRTKRSN